MKAGAVAFLVLPFLLTSLLDAQRSLALRVGRAWLGPDQKLERPVFLIDGGKIVDVAQRGKDGSSSPFASQAERVLDFGEAVATAGFLDLQNLTAPPGELHERVESLTPRLRAEDAYDPFLPSWKELWRRGVTSICLSPDDQNLAGGLAAFLKPGPTEWKAREEAFLKMSLTRSMLNRERRPTSLLGAVDYLREVFEGIGRTEPPAWDPLQRAMAPCLEGGRTVGIAASTRAEIRAALNLVKEFRLRAFLIGVEEGADEMEALRAAGIPVVLRAFAPSAPKRALELPARLAKAGIPVAFCGESTDRYGLSRLRTSMYFAIRNGLPPSKALAAVTSVPAEILKLKDRVGGLFKGRDADVCIWSRAPWDPRARLLAVLRDGTLLWKAPGKDATKVSTRTGAR